MNSEKSKIEEEFFQLIRYALGVSDDYSRLTEEEWERIDKYCCEQGLLPWMYAGIERMPQEGKPHQELMLQWYVDTLGMQQHSRNATKCVLRLTQQIEQDGLKTCVLKGVGCSMLYPEPDKRIAGDIDIWIIPQTGSSNDIISYVKQRFPNVTDAIYHHVVIADYKGQTIEVHFRPSFMTNPLHNYRLQQWFASQAEAQSSHRTELPGGKGTIACPTTDFNMVYLMSHIAKHIVQDSVTLKSILDYYYLLRQRGRNCDNSEALRLMRRFGLMPYTRAVMYILHDTFGMESDYLIAPPDARKGAFLLKEIMRGTDFGQPENAPRWMKESWVGRSLLRLGHDIRVARHFPSECLWEPAFRLWHFVWKKAQSSK